VDGLFRFLGHREICYFKYLDLGRGGTLIARPGEVHHIYATEEGVPLPPQDGRWVPVSEPEPDPEPEPESVRSVKAKTEPAPSSKKEEPADSQESE
jgi:hypothetical protein